MIETSQFQTLVALAKFKSFSRAAEELGVTQSAISQSIRNLEKKVGIKLFKRAGKQIHLTVEGQKLHQLAVEFLDKLEKTLDEITYDKNSMSGKVRIGALTGIGKSWLASELLKFTVDNPNLIVNITLGFEEDLIRDFENLKLDMIILPEEFLPSSGERVLLGEENSTLVFPKSDKFLINKNITLEELVEYPTVVFDFHDPLYFKWCKQYFGKVPKEINVKYSINSHGNMLQAVINELGVAIIPTHVLRRSVYKDKVNTLGESAALPLGRFYLVYHKDSEELFRISETIKHLTSCDNPLSAV